MVHITILGIFLSLLFSASAFDFYNVGTTLFKKSDTSKKCWSETDKDLLIARRVMQDLLPQPDLVDFSDPQAIPTLLEYFRTSFTLVKQGSSGQTQQHLITALADAVGGYLRAIVLPITRAAYYAGRISYDDAYIMTALYEDLKMFLKTTGHSWRPPDSTAYHVQFMVTPLEVNSAGDKAACDNLLIEEAETEIELEKRKKRNSTESGFSEPSLQKSSKKGAEETNTGMMPLPLLDNDDEPKAIAIPWKDKPLVSLSSNESAYIIPKYYVSAVKCIASMSNSKEDIVHFNTALYNWINNKVMPHLSDETWYVGFGGVLRVIESIRSFGVDLNNIDVTLKPDGHYVFGDGVEIGKNPHQWPLGGETKGIGDTWASRSHHLVKDAFGAFGVNGNSTSHLILIVTLIALALLICCVCCCCAWCGRHNKSPRQVISNLSDKVRSTFTSFHGPTDARKEHSPLPSSRNQQRNFLLCGSGSSREHQTTSKSSHISSGRSNKLENSPRLQDKSFALSLASGDCWRETSCPQHHNDIRSHSCEKVASNTSSSLIQEDSRTMSESSSTSSESGPGSPK